MAQQQSGGGNAQNPSNDLGTLLVGVFLLLVVAWVIWTRFHTEMVLTSIWIRKGLLYPLSLFSDTAKILIERLNEINPATMPFKSWTMMLEVTGRVTRWLLFALVLVIALKVYFSAYTTRFVRRHSIKSLVQQEKAIWPEIAPVADLDLIAMDPHQGPWASAMSEREFARFHKLLDDEGHLIRDKAEKVFASQLGARWRGVEYLPPHQRAMFALFATRIGGDSKGALSYARRMAASFKGDAANLDLAWVDEALAKHGNHPLVQRCIAQHAWVFTVLCTMLQISRIDGVFASPLWIWLRPTDRRLFYALNGVGRYAHFPEVAGVMAVWRAEKKFGMPIGFPDVKAAVDGLELALKDFCDDDILERIFK